ncbi:MAG: hypothetical protein PHF63_00760 [Herbinix sp.]|nr:hypothetical protein [Herbinix sp.]
MMDIPFSLHKIKHSKLDELFDKCDEIQLNKNSTVNVFINMENVVNKIKHNELYTFNRGNLSDNVQELTSNIINLSAHYRYYFNKRKIKSNVYVYGQYPLIPSYIKNRNILENYRIRYYNMYTKDLKYSAVTETITNAIPIAKTILQYIEGVYFIEADFMESALIPMVVNSYHQQEGTSQGSYNFIVTMDRYEYQYVNYGYYILRPNPKNNAVILTKNNIVNQIKSDYSIISSELDFSPSNIPIIYSFLGNLPRSILNIKRFGIKKTLKLLQGAIDNQIITPNTNHINMIMSFIQQSYCDEVKDNFDVTDLVSQFNRLSLNDKYYIYDQIIDTFDNKSLRELNDYYFPKFPLMLIEIDTFKNRKNPFDRK